MSADEPTPPYVTRALARELTEARHEVQRIREEMASAEPLLRGGVLYYLEGLEWRLRAIDRLTKETLR
jgi:hypothetical protein